MKMKLHSPSWHKGGRKFTLGNYASLSVGLDDHGRPRARWRSGLRNHHHEQEAVSVAPVRLTSIGSLARPFSSARGVAVAGRYKNLMRSTVYG